MNATLPQPANPTTSDSAVYDAWQRLVTLSSGGSTIAANAYDGLHRRVSKLISGTLRLYYYSASLAGFEERSLQMEEQKRRWPTVSLPHGPESR